MATRSKYVFRVATPYSTGTGVYLPQYGLLVTNEHVVRDNASVVIGNAAYSQQLVPVVYLDAHYDLAFLRPDPAPDLPELPLSPVSPEPGSRVLALGLHFGQPLQRSEGQLLDDNYAFREQTFLLHDARQSANHSGGPLFGEDGSLLGINMYALSERHGGALSLPAIRLLDCIATFERGGGRPATRCPDCRQITFEVRLNPSGHCPNCGAPLLLPNLIEEPATEGVAATIEEIIRTAGHDPRLARRGPNLWSIRQGSADIQIAYHEESGLVTGDAHLCRLPELPRADLLAFLLRQNNALQQLTFSTYGRDVLLSLLIYDRYLRTETALPQFEHLFAKADEYDDVLVEQYGAAWLEE